MLFAKAALALVTLVAGVAADGHLEPSKYYATLGKFGTFEMEISADDGTMTWTSDLHNIDELSAELGIDPPISALNYHLHQSWALDEDYAIGGEACGAANLGGHYDPFFACGPASGVPRDQCIAIGKERSSDRYQCSGSYELGNYAECEVGDLSGKEGALVVNDDGSAGGSPDEPDPLAAQDTQYVAERTINSADKWASILFHVGAPRVLCGKIFKGELPPTGPTCELEFVLWDADKDEPVEVLGEEFCFDGDYEFNIQARPTAGCSTTLSAYMEMSGPIHEDRTENAGPYMIFGDVDSGANVFGRDFEDGDYTIYSSVYSEKFLNGDVVVDGSLDFSFVSCGRRNLRD